MTMIEDKALNILRACEFGGLGDIAEGVTYQELVELDDGFGKPAIHYAAESRQLDKIKGGVTANQLAEAVHADTGETALHRAADMGSLDQINGGATAHDLIAAKDKEGRTALQEALIGCPLSQIQGGLQSGLLKPDELDDILQEILSCEYIDCGSETEEKVDRIIDVGANKNIVLEALGTEASDAEAKEEIPDWQVEKLRFLMGLADKYNFKVSDVVSPAIIAKLI